MMTKSGRSRHQSRCSARRGIALALAFILLFGTGWSPSQATDVRPLSENERREYALLSPFEFKNELGDAARTTAQARLAEVGIDLAYPQRKATGVTVALEKFLAEQKK